MIDTKLIDGCGDRHRAKINDKNELIVRARSLTDDYEPTAVPWVNQVNKMRITPVQSSFEGRFFYGLNNDEWQSAANVNGSRVYLPNDNGVSLQIPTTSGSKYIDITKRFFPYAPDTVIHSATAIAFTPRKNLRQFWGLVSWQGGTIKDGYILRMHDQQLQFVKISSSRDGLPIETVHPQSTWEDPMDGTGRSGISLDFSSLQMVEIDHAWYGGGTANLRFRLGGKSYLADRFFGANQKSDRPIIANPVLSVAYGIEAIGTLSAAAEFIHYGLSVSSDDNNMPIGKPYAGFSGNKTVSGGSWTPIYSLRLKSNFSIDGAAAKPNVYGYVTNLNLAVTVLNRDTDIALIRSASLTGASFGSIVDLSGAAITNSMVEQDTSATSANGIPIYGDTVPSDTRVQISTSEDDVISVDSLGVASNTFTVVARPTAGGSATVKVSANWREVY